MVLLAAAAILVIVGLVGVVLPAIPGTILIFAGLWLAAWSDGFMRVGVATIIALGIMAGATYFVDAATMALGMTVGLFLGLPGLIVGPFAGAVLGELTAHHDVRRAGMAGLAAWIGFVIGTAVKIGLAFVMVGIFLAAWFVF